MEENSQNNHQNENHTTGEYLLNLAVVIMGTISCYTTAVGVAPMLNNKFLAYLIAVALSLFMVVIAINLPKTDTKAKKRGSIFAYSVVAIFSILLNFNAIYGISNAKTLLYEELDTKRNALISLQRTTQEDIDSLHQVSYWQGQVAAARQEMELEKLTPGEEGCGPKCRKIYREKLLPASGKLEEAQQKSTVYRTKIEDKIKSIYPEPINTVLESGDPKLLEGGIQDIIEVYQDVAKDIGPVTNKDYGTLSFENKNVGNLNHAVNTIFSISRKGGEAKASIFISLLISFIIDFLILFVILFLSPSMVDIQEKVQPSYNYRRPEPSTAKPFERIKNIFSGDDTKKQRKADKSDGPFVNRD